MRADLSPPFIVYVMLEFSTLHGDELLWAAITIGRPSTYHVFRYGTASFHEAIFRLSLIRLAVEEDWGNRLRRTDAFVALDPTEKGMGSYFLGMTLCKLFASRLLNTPWLLHLDVFRSSLSAVILALQLLLLRASESMGNHDSNVVGAGRVG